MAAQRSPGRQAVWGADEVVDRVAGAVLAAGHEVGVGARVKPGSEWPRSAAPALTLSPASGRPPRRPPAPPTRAGPEPHRSRRGTDELTMTGARWMDRRLSGR